MLLLLHTKGVRASGWGYLCRTASVHLDGKGAPPTALRNREVVLLCRRPEAHLPLDLGHSGLICARPFLACHRVPSHTQKQHAWKVWPWGTQGKAVYRDSALSSHGSPESGWFSVFRDNQTESGNTPPCCPVSCQIMKAQTLSHFHREIYREC